jgi:DNA-binding transcriptional ArsR family regulator
MVEHSPLDGTYAAIASPVRRELLEVLRAGDARVTELAQPFGMSLAAVSKHLRVLESAGLIRRAVRGRDHHLSLEAAPLAGAAGWLDTYREFWEGRLDVLEERLRGSRRT